MIMCDSLRIKAGSIFLFFAIFLSLVLLFQKSDELQEEKPSSISQNEESKQLFTKSDSADLPKGIVTTAPTPIINQQGKVKGEISQVNFENDLETSLKIQQTPTIWLEYINENNKVEKVEIPKKVQSFIEKRWLRTLQYSYQNQSTDDWETKISINKNYINDAAVYATSIANFEIVTPLEKRNISREEAFEMMRIVAKLAIDRCKELQNMSAVVNTQKIYQ